jgi:hypothetical protein
VKIAATKGDFMKSALVLAAALLVSTMARAEEAKPARNPDTADFSQAYLDQVKTERAKEEPSPEELRREHAKYMKETARTDRLSRGN